MGYVDQVTGSKTVGDYKKYRLYKFVINNGDNTRIEVLVWGDLIPQYEPRLQLNQVSCHCFKNIYIHLLFTFLFHFFQKIFLDGLRAKRTSSTIYRTDNNIVPVELNVQHSTTIEILGTHVDTIPEDSVTPVTNFVEALEIQGLISVTGYFRSQPKRMLTNTATCVLTDGFRQKIDVEIRNYQPTTNFVRGAHVRITGRIEMRGEDFCNLPWI